MGTDRRDATSYGELLRPVLCSSRGFPFIIFLEHSVYTAGVEYVVTQFT